MLFNSLEFAIFLPIVFLLYWFATNKNLKLQNFLLVGASYFFYAWWDWRFLFLVLFNTIFNFSIGLGLSKYDNRIKRDVLLWMSILVNLGLLCFFKYYNFFLETFITAFSFFGREIKANSLNIILPVGISFYTFLTLGYSIDVYKRKFEPTNNFIAFSAFVSFFPLLLAGPIERASNLLSQLLNKRQLSYNLAIDGLFQALWGLFKKAVIADNCSELVNVIFSSQNSIGSVLLLGALFFTLQIYCDFSGYSDIAIGISKLFGLNLMLNFKFPYFSRDIAEFWRRWHISLTTWFRDYLFLPVSFSISWRIKNEKVLFLRTDMFIYIVASIIVWFLTGLWHGANYTFIIWGIIHGFFLILYHWQRKPRKRLLRKLGISNDHSLIIIIETVITMFIVMLTWIFFRSDSVNQALAYIKGIFKPSLFTVPKMVGEQNTTIVIVIIMVVLMFFTEWKYRKEEFVFKNIYRKEVSTQLFVIAFLITLIIIFGGSSYDFIYFQF